MSPASTRRSLYSLLSWRRYAAARTLIASYSFSMPVAAAVLSSSSDSMLKCAFNGADLVDMHGVAASGVCTFPSAFLDTFCLSGSSRKNSQAANTRSAAPLWPSSLLSQSRGAEVAEGVHVPDETVVGIDARLEGPRLLPGA